MLQNQACVTGNPWLVYAMTFSIVGMLLLGILCQVYTGVGEARILATRQEHMELAERMVIYQRLSRMI